MNPAAASCPFPHDMPAGMIDATPAAGAEGGKDQDIRIFERDAM
jgi:hypothetical protein